MRSLVVMAMFASSLACAAWNGYTENRDLALDADGVEILEIDSGAGSVVVTGIATSDEILAKATIRVPDDDKGARDFLARELVLSLEKKRGKAILEAHFEDNSWFDGDSASIDIDVSMPDSVELFIDDGSGSILVKGMRADVEIDDGSGSIDINGARSVVIDDGSGPITIIDVSGDVDVEDGSGEIRIQTVGGTVTIDDGSGSIDVRDVAQDLDIIDAGSGSVRIADVRGKVSRDD